MTAQPIEQPEDRWETIKSLWKRHQFLYVLAGFLLGLLAFPLLQLAITDLSTFLGDLAPEAVSTLVAVLVIDRIYRIHADKERLQELITQMRSKNNGLALAALEIVKLKGWPEDGSLKGANLMGANLERAVLWYANLERAVLGDANLQWANLWRANLQGANLWLANLQGAHLGDANLQGAFLEGANLQGAFLWGAKFYEDTTLPDGTFWTPDTDMMRFAYPDRPDFWRSNVPFSPAYRGDTPSP